MVNPRQFSKGKTVEFVLEPQQIMVYYDTGNFMAEPGFLEISVGSDLPGFGPETSSIIVKRVEIAGYPYLVKR